MIFNRLFFSLLFVAFSSALMAQCGSGHTNSAKAVKTSWSPDKDIIDIAVGNEDFSTLVTAIKAADLVNTLKGEGPFTVFAPVNAAFAKLPKGTVENLLQAEQKATLTNILTYHVVAGEFKAADVINAIKATDGAFAVKTVSGNLLKASLSNGNVILTDENGGTAVITATDIAATNGVIHVIDSVVLPK